MKFLAALLISACAFAQDASPPPPAVSAPPAPPVITVDVAPLAPPDLNSPYASPRDAARHRLQDTMAQLQTTRSVRAAIQGFAEAFAADRTYATAAFDLAIVAAIAEKWSDALAAFEEAVRLDPAGLGATAAPSIERLRKLAALEASPAGKLERRYDEALYPLLQRLPKLPAADAIQALADIGRIDPKRWEAPALIASLAGDDRAYQSAVDFLEIASKNAAAPEIKSRIEKALEAARREQRYGAARSEADAALDRGEYEKAAGLFEKAWSAMPARSSNGMEGASAWLLHDDTSHASTLLARLRDGGDPDLAPLATAMLAQLAPVEPAAKASTSDAREFFRDPGATQPVVIADLIPPVDTASMEILARPLPKLRVDAEPVTLLAALSLNPAEAQPGAAMPSLAAPRISADTPWRDILQLPAGPAPEPAPAPAPQSQSAERPLSSRDLSPDSRTGRTIQVTTQPAGARIFNGEDTNPACESPCALRAAPGTYKLQFFLTGYRPETREVQVGGKNVDVEVTLAQVRGSILIDAPAEAVIKVNGTAVQGHAPFELSLFPGLYRISTDTRERAITVKPDARLRLDLK
jgi:tetratricopeptide (TPR) repeat protein